MPRSTDEWQGKTDDTPIPPRVRLRVKVRASDCCENCGIRVRYEGQVDHVVALINGGENREANLRFLCKHCHAAKSRRDVAEKSKVASTQKRMAGFDEPKRGHWSLSRKMNGDVCRWNPSTKKYDILVYSPTHSKGAR